MAGLFKDGNQPSALEFMERAAIELAMDFTGDRQLPLTDDRPPTCSSKSMGSERRT